MQFERVGAFAYSPQDGTRAAEMIDDVPDGVKRDRLERLTDLQRAITAERYEQRIGSRVHALVERSADESTEGAVARLPWQADDIDGVTWLDVDAPAGSFVEVEVTDVVDDYDFSARVMSLIDAPIVAPRASSRELPLATIGSFGR
jgi:ribosomal protein S12 methylthiotransferase